VSCKWHEPWCYHLYFPDPLAISNVLEEQQQLQQQQQQQLQQWQ